MLKTYARHYKTGEVIPDELIKKLNNASKFNQGFTTTELAGAALLDLEWGQTDGKGIDVAGFEAKVSDKIGMPGEITYRYRSPYFKHIFGDDGYASGYYTYLWSQVLEADAWELFERMAYSTRKLPNLTKRTSLKAATLKTQWCSSSVSEATSLTLTLFSASVDLNNNSWNINLQMINGHGLCLRPLIICRFSTT